MSTNVRARAIRPWPLAVMEVGRNDQCGQTKNKVGRNDIKAKKQALMKCFLSIAATVTILMAAMTIAANVGGGREAA
jgi:hypothetical protein